MRDLVWSKYLALTALGFLTLLNFDTSARASNIEVGTCVEFDTCYFGSTPTPFSTSLSSMDLTGLGLGSTQSLFVVQTSPFVIRLGQTTFDFTTSTGSVMEKLAEFNGPVTITSTAYNVGSFFIPSNALSAVVSGTFGNSTVPNSAGANVFIGVSPVPLPPALPMFGAVVLFLGAVGVVRRRRNDTQPLGHALA